MMKGGRRWETGDWDRQLTDLGLNECSQWGTIMGKRISRFEDLEVWKESMRLAIKVHRAFVKTRVFGLKDQIQRATVSVPSNIAEGFERHFNKEFIQYLYVARGSCGEVRTQLYLASALHLIEQPQGHSLIEDTRKVSAMLTMLIRTRRMNF